MSKNPKDGSIIISEQKVKLLYRYNKITSFSCLPLYLFLILSKLHLMLKSASRPYHLMVAK